MIARLPRGINQAVIEAMQSMKVIPIVNGFIVELAKIIDNVWQKPQGLPEGTKILHLAAERMDESFAYVIAGMRGEKFKPIHSSRKTGWQARFALNKYIELAYQKSDDTLIISIMVIREHDEAYELAKEEIYVGYPEDVPGNLLYLESAIQAVIKKSNCPGCTHIHYCL